MNTTSDEINKQRIYYSNSAASYNEMHLDESDEHYFALSFLISQIDRLGISSILDIGSGTGRAIQYIKQFRPDVRIIGIEPVKELREIGYMQGIAKNELIDGDALKLEFSDQEFDCVTEFGVLHHIRKPTLAISEMLRVSKIAIFISDSNNFGQGSPIGRITKQIANAVGLWNIVDFIKTRGKGYTISEGDGLGYSYSVFNNYKQIAKHCKSIHLLNTKDGGINLYRTASHVALLGIKNE